MSFPVRLEVVSSKDVKSKKRWRRIQWDGEQSENISLLGSRTLAQFNLVTGKKRRVDASIRRVLGRVVHISGSMSGTCIVGMLQDGHLFRWRKNTRTITNILPCPGFNPSTSVTPGETPNQVFRKPKLFISDDGSMILLFSRHSGVYVWRGVGFSNSGWSKVGIGSAASALLSSKGVSLDTVFYADQVTGLIVKCAFASSLGECISVGILTLHPSQPESAPSYSLNKYQYSDFTPHCIPIRLRESLLPCWSRNGRVLALAVNQRRPSLARILFIQPNSGGVVNVGFARILQSAVEMSFWISSLSWTHDHLFLACATKQGAVLLVSASGNVMQIVAKSPAEKFGPGIFLPLEGVVGFRRPAHESVPREIDESTDTSMQSSVLPPKLRKPYYTVSAHPSLPILLCGDGYSVAAMKIMDSMSYKDMTIVTLGETVQRIERIIKRNHLQIVILEPLSYFTPALSEEYDSEKEQHWRQFIKSAHDRLQPDVSLNREVDVSKENSPEQEALLSFLIEDLDESRLLQSESKHEATQNDSITEDAAVYLVRDIISCRGNLLSSLMLLSLSLEDGHHKTSQMTADLTQNRVDNTELATMYVMVFRLYCDILLQLQDIADIFPSETLTESFLSKNGDETSLRTVICDVLSSLGRGILSLVSWDNFSHSVDMIYRNVVEEIVNAMLLSGRHSPEGCLSGEDVFENLQQTFLFLVKAETCVTRQISVCCRSLACDPTVPCKINTAMEVDAISNEPDDQTCYSKELHFPLAWQVLMRFIAKLQTTGSHFRKELKVIDSIAAYLQKRTCDQIVLPDDFFGLDDITATKVLQHVCKSLSQYHFSSAMACAFGNLCHLILNTTTWTDEKWLPVEIFGRVMASYFCGSPVTVPCVTGALSESTNRGGYFFETLQQEKITSTIRAQSLGESWSIDNAVLLLLSCGRIRQAAGIASNVGDWRTAFVLSALFEKTSSSNVIFTRNINADESHIESLLKSRFQDIVSSIFGVKIEISDDFLLNLTEKPESFVEIDPFPYSRCLTDVFEVSAMVGKNITTWSAASVLNTLKSRCAQGVPLLVPTDFNLPHPELYLPQSTPNTPTQDAETKFRNEISAFSRVILAILNSIGIQRVVALWYLKYLDREARCDHAHHGSCCERRKTTASLADNALLKDVTVQGLEMQLEELHGNGGNDEVYLLAAVFRELCSILLMFHVRDKLTSAVRKYQKVREKFAADNKLDIEEDSGSRFPANDTQNEIYAIIYECLFWVRKFQPFAKFIHLEADMEELILCLVAELPMTEETAEILAEFFHHERLTTPKNKHRLQVAIEKMRKIQISDAASQDLKPLSAIFNEKCRTLVQRRRPLFSGHFSVPQVQITSKSTGEMSQTDTLSRDEPSVLSKLTPDSLLSTLENCYAFEADEMYHKFVFEFLEIALSKSPATTTFTPKKERKSRPQSRPLSYPLVLTYRNEIATSKLEMIPPPDERRSTLLSMVVPVRERRNTSLSGREKGKEAFMTQQVEEEETSHSHPLSIFNWQFFKRSELESGKNSPKFTPEMKEVPTISVETLSPELKKRLQRLVPYFMWLEHWRSQLIPMPQSMSLEKQRKPAMRISIATEHLIHGFTMAELRFGKKVKKKERREEKQTASESYGVSSSCSEEGSVFLAADLPDDEHKKAFTRTKETVPKVIVKPSMRWIEPSKSPLEVMKDEEKTLEPSELHSGTQKTAVAQSPEKEVHDTPDGLSHLQMEDLEIQETEKTAEERTTGIITEPTQNEASLEAEDLIPDVPQLSSGNLLRKILHKDGTKETRTQATDVMSHSALSVASTGLQSDLMPDGGGRRRNSKLVKKNEMGKQEMQEVVQNEIRNAMIGQQVLFLAQIFQSTMMQASNILSQTQQKVPLSTQGTQSPSHHHIPPTLPPPPVPRRNEGNLQILSLDPEKSYILPNSKFSKKPGRPPLALLTENQSLRKSQTAFLHDEKSIAPKMFTPSKMQGKATDTVPTMYKTPNDPYPAEKKGDNGQQQKTVDREAGGSTLTPDMLRTANPGEKVVCPTCHSHPGPRTAIRLPLLGAAASIEAAAATHHQGRVADAFPRLINIRRILHYEQKRMAESGQQSKSVVHMGKALPLLDAEKVLGFYRLKPKFQEIPFVIPKTKPPSQTEFPPKSVKIQPPEERTEAQEEVSAPPDGVDESRVEIPKELLPTVLTEEEARGIRNGVLSHYKFVVDQQKLMWREAGQQTDAFEEETQDKGVGPSPEHEQLRQAFPRRSEKPTTDRYEMHQEFLDRFLDVDKDRVPDQDSLPTKELKAHDVTQMQGPEADMKIPAVQTLVKSRWSSAMNEMSSEMDAVTEMERDMRYRIPYVSETIVKSTSRTSSAVSAEIRPQIYDRRSTTSSHSAQSSSRSAQRPRISTYIPPSELILGVGNRFSQQPLPRDNEHHIPHSGLNELAKYRRKIDEAFSLADFGPHREPSDHSLHSSHQVTPASSMHKMDGSVLSSLSWDELEAMVTDSILADAEGEHGRSADVTSVDGRIQDALQILDELQAGSVTVVKKATKPTKKQPQITPKIFKKRDHDVDARIEDAMSLLNEIKTDHNQLKTGGRPVGTRVMMPTKTAAKSRGVDNWTLEAMSLLKELKDEYEPENRAVAKENLPPEAFGKTDSDNMRAHIEEAMALLRDDASISPVSYQPSSHVSFQPTSQMPKRHY